MFWKLLVCVQSRLSCVPLSAGPKDCSLPGSSVHGNFQARILEWVAIPSSRGWTHMSFVSPALEGRFFTISTTGEAWKLFKHSLLFFPDIIFFSLKSNTGRRCYSHFRDKERVLEVWSNSHRKSLSQEPKPSRLLASGLFPLTASAHDAMSQKTWEQWFGKGT